jgi:hypothetical protein
LPGPHSCCSAQIMSASIRGRRKHPPCDLHGQATPVAAVLGLHGPRRVGAALVK